MMRGEVARLTHMKRSIFVSFFFMAAPLFAQQPPEIRFHSIPNFLKLPPDLHLGEATGVAVNSKGHIFVFSRSESTGPAYGASAAQLLEFSPHLKFLPEIDPNLYPPSSPHPLHVPQDHNHSST